MIDVHYFSDNNDGFVVPDEVNKTTVPDSSDEEMKTGNDFSLKLEGEETKSEEKKGGFKLFGVMIQQ